MKFLIPVKTTNPLNGSWGHWRGKAARRKVERAIAYAKFAEAESGGGIQWGPAPRVTLTRLYSGRPSDSDGLAASQKSIRDGIADFMELDDAEIEWVYEQKKCKRGIFGVEVEIE